MGTFAASVIDSAVSGASAAAQTAASITNTNNTNKTNLQIAQETNKQNAANVAATNAANVQMNDATNQANLAINKATNEANVAMTDKTNAANLAINKATNEANYNIAQETNRANAEIAQMNNEYNEKMLERQIQQEWEMWNAENEYNSPAAQMARQREAGINPYVAASSGSITSGNASSMTSPGAQPAAGYTAQGATMQAAQMQAPLLQPTSLTPGHVDAAQAQMVGVSPTDFSSINGFRGIVGSFFDTLQKQNEVDKGRIENDMLNIEKKYKAQQLLTQIAEAQERTKSTKARRKLDEIAADYQGDMFSSEIQQRREQTFLTQLQAAGQVVSNLSALQWYKALPTQIKQTINEQATRISNMRLQGKLTKEQIKTEVEKQFDTMASRWLKEDQHQMNWETWNIQKRKMVADLIDAILSPASGNPLDMISKGFYSFGAGQVNLFDPDYWNQ